MSLRWRIALVVVVAAVLPVAVSGWLLSTFALDQARSELGQRLDATARAARDRVEHSRARERAGVVRVCEDDLLVDRLLADLEADGFGPIEQEDLAERLPGMMRGLGLDVLLLLDGRPGGRFGRVLAAGHLPGHAGADEGALAEAVEEAGARWFVRSLRVRRGDRIASHGAAMTGCATSPQRAARIIAVGGRVLDDSFVASIAPDLPPVRVLLTGADGALPAEASVEGPREQVWSFGNLAGEPVATIVAVADERPLRDKRKALDRRVLIAVGVAAIAALLLGLGLAVSITRPLGELSVAANRVAGGDMRSTVTVRSGGEVGRALRAFNRMTNELDRAQARLLRAERIAAWRDIARRIAHEIKNPLMPIQTSIETMRKTHARRHPDFDEIFEESTQTILEEVERMKTIVTEFSRFARLPRPRPVDLDVRDVAQHVVGLHANDAALVQLEASSRLPTVRADREQLTQVLVNLVQNAADAARARHGDNGGQVWVTVVAAADGGVTLAVEDNGPGIVVDERERVFEPYFTTKPGGTGLGLAIVHRIVSDHGGSVDIEEGGAGGARVEVHLTRAGPPREAETTHRSSPVH